MITQSHATHARRSHHGFTLIELLIVISILGLLAAVLLPEIMNTSKLAKQKACEATMIELETGLNGFTRKFGIYPPDDFKAFDQFKGTWKPDNGTNTGIESMVCFLSQSLQGGVDLGNHADAFTNTDGDQHGQELPLLHRSDRLELADPWGTPFVYFAKSGMGRTQKVQVSPEEAAVDVKAKCRPDGTPYGAGKFQLLSAGPDMTFGTDDDIVFPAN